MRLFFTKGVVELVVKILDKYTYKEFLKTHRGLFCHKVLADFHIKSPPPPIGGGAETMYNQIALVRKNMEPYYPCT